METKKHHIPDSQYVRALHETIFREFRDEGDPIGIPGIKSIDMLESACMRPHTSFGSVEKYESTLEKLAALFYSLVMNHPFHDGNKRTAVVSLISGLSLNKLYFKPETTDESIFGMVVSLAKGDFPPNHGHLRPQADFVVSELYSWLLASTTQQIISEYRTTDEPNPERREIRKYKRVLTLLAEYDRQQEE
jgi:death-on-curing protein